MHIGTRITNKHFTERFRFIIFAELIYILSRTATHKASYSSFSQLLYVIYDGVLYDKVPTIPVMCCLSSTYLEPRRVSSSKAIAISACSYISSCAALSAAASSNPSSNLPLWNWNISCAVKLSLYYCY